MLDVGIKFGLVGADKAESHFRKLGAEYNKLSHTIDRGTGSFGRISSTIGKGTAALTAGTAAVVAYKAAVVGALAVVTKKIGESREELTALYHDLRALGKGSKDLAQFEKAMMDYSDTYSGMTTTKGMEAAYDVISATPELTTKAQAALVQTAATLGKLTKMSAAESAEYLTSYIANHRARLQREGKDTVEAAKEYAAQTAKAVAEAKTKGATLLESTRETSALSIASGWGQKRTLALAAALNEKFRGGITDTFMSDLFSKAGVGYGKLMSRLDKRWQDPDEAKGQSRSAILRENKKLMAEYSGAGADLWKSDPHKYLDAVAGGLERLKKIDPNWQRFIQLEGYEESVAKRLPVILESRERFAELEKKIGAASWTDAQKRAAEVDADLKARHDRMRNRIDNFWKTVGRATEPAQIKAYDWIGAQFMGSRKDLETAMDQLQTSVNAMSSNMWSSFQEAFQVNPEFKSWLSDIVGLLREPNADEWARIGSSLGKMAGTDLSQLVDTLNLVKDAGKGVWDVIGPLVNGMGALIKTSLEGWAKLHKAWNEDGLKQDVEGVGKRLGNMFGGGDEMLDSAEGKVQKGPGPIGRADAAMEKLVKKHGVLGAMARLRNGDRESTGFSAWPGYAGPTAGTAPGFRGRGPMMPSTAQAGRSPQEQRVVVAPAQPVDANINIQVDVDGRTIDRRVERRRIVDANRAGLGHGER